MAPVTMVVGLVLIALAVIGYWPTQAPTALIPGGFGVLLMVLGLLALREKGRKHVMHAAVLVGLIGLLLAGGRVIMKGVSGTIGSDLGSMMLVSMTLTCAVFVALCVRSFIVARRRRQQTGA